jgi:GMP synthase (glutamine-hydrolysing)
MKIIIVDFGAPAVERIANFLKTSGVSYEIFNPCRDKYIPKCDGIILSGGPDSVCKSQHRHLNDDNHILTNPKVPVLGICYGAQLICKYNGGKLKSGNLRECFDTIKVDRRYKLYKGLDKNGINVKFRHSDYILKMPKSFTVTSFGKHKGQKIIFSFQDINRNLYGVQYHPEVKCDFSTDDGGYILNNFLMICETKR